MTYPLQIAERGELLARAESLSAIIEGDVEKSEADRTLAMSSVDALG